MNLNDIKIAIIGLGYVGLPLAVEFCKKYNVVGYDVNERRIEELSAGIDTTLEVPKKDLNKANNLKFSNKEECLKDANIFIITVPTPINEHKQPDLSYLENASELVSNYLKKQDFVIYESTVYPGATEEVCVPILEKFSKLKFNTDFFVGYSPERINPGDKDHRVSNILKVTSGSTIKSADFIDDLYGSIIDAGTFKASSIKVAEAAKVIENTQRDVNIALINELTIIFNKLNINTNDVLEAAETKWNFLPFKPGLVGGHCIGVDPYYLTFKAQSAGYHPEMILAGRRLNDNMGSYVAGELIKKMIKKDIDINVSRVLIMGLTFKENCPDLRNTKVIDMVDELNEYNILVDVMDPLCSKDEAKKQYNLDILETPPAQAYDSVIIAVGHSIFKELGIKWIKNLCKENHIIYDLKNSFNSNEVDLQL